MDYDAYWKANGPYLASESVSPEHQASEIILRDVLNSLGQIKSVLDVGCGQGRIAKLLKDVLPKAKYAGVDFGPQVRGTAKVRPDGTFYEARIQDFEPGKQWDLVIASEVLMHIPPADIQGVCDKLRRLSKKYVVSIDWTEPLEGEIAEWNWRFDYPALYGSVERMEKIGLQTVFVVSASSASHSAQIPEVSPPPSSEPSRV